MADAPDRRDAVARELAEHRSTLFAFILSIVRDFDLAAEVFGELAFSVSARAGEAPPTGFVDWAARLAREAIAQAAEVPLSREAIEAVARAAQAEPPADWLESLRRRRDALRGQTRSVLAMRYRDRMGGALISRRTKTTPAKVHASLLRARVALAQGLPLPEEKP